MNMINRDEIEAKAKEFDIHTANVERDYVFGWLLAGIYSSSQLKDILILKGGNCLRKAYFINTRFSNDLDFSIITNIDSAFLIQELNKVCDFVQEATGIVFEKDKNRIEEKARADKTHLVHEVRLYFKDFYGNPDKITISVRLDISEFDRIYLPIQKRNIIHPYSDANQCIAEINCLKLEEMLAAKLKCLLQRQHSGDLYDFIYSVFINKEVAVQKSEIIWTFLKKTIFEPSPIVAKNLLLELPFEVFRVIWNEYVVCPKQSIINFDDAMSVYKKEIEALFSSYPTTHRAISFYPSKFRNPIIEAGRKLNLLSITYDGYKRTVEPYSLVYKRRQDGHGEEYFYAFDRTGGNSGPGIKCFVNTKLTSIEILPDKYEPKYEVELAKAGEHAKNSYFSRPFAKASSIFSGGNKKSRGTIYIVQCDYCNKTFKRSTSDTHLKKHKDKYHNDCYGRHGHIIEQTYEY